MEDRVKQLETMVTRLARRSVKRSTGLITPYPISSAFFGDSIPEVILRYMFPCEGTITKAMLRLGTKPKEPITLTLSLSDDSKSSSKGVVVDKKSAALVLSIDVWAGACLSVSVTGAKVNEVWISFLWTPTIKDITAKSFLIDDLENANA